MNELDWGGYLGVDLCSDERMEAKWKYKLSEGRKVAGTLKNVWKKRMRTTGANIGMCNGTAVSYVLKLDKEIIYINI